MSDRDQKIQWLSRQKNQFAHLPRPAPRIKSQANAHKACPNLRQSLYAAIVVHWPAIERHRIDWLSVPRKNATLNTKDSIRENGRLQNRSDTGSLTVRSRLVLSAVF